MLRAAISADQIETSRTAVAWPTGCVWTAHPWPELLRPAWRSNPLKANYKTITMTAFWKNDNGVGGGESVRAERALRSASGGSALSSFPPNLLLSSLS